MITSRQHIWRFPRKDDPMTAEEYVRYPEIVDTTVGLVSVFWLRKNSQEGEEGGVHFGKYISESLTSTENDREIVIEVVTVEQEKQAIENLKSRGYTGPFKSTLPRIPKPQKPKSSFPDLYDATNRPKISDRITDLLKQYIQQGKYWLTPQEIALELNANINTVYSGIRELNRERRTTTKRFPDGSLALALLDYVGESVGYRRLRRSSDR